MSDIRRFSERLLADLSQLGSEVEDVLRRSEIHNVDPNRHGGGVFFIGAAKWGWVNDDSFIGERTRLLARFEEWTKQFRLLQRNALATTQQRIDRPLDLVRRWVGRDRDDPTLPSSTDDAIREASVAFVELADLVRIATHGPSAVIAVPDANCLLRQPDVARYADAVGTDKYTVVMLTTVVSELDGLKDRGRTEDVRKGARTALRRLKGLRDRGDIREGVRVEAEVFLKMEHHEVQLGDIFDWLDSSVPDDRILAGALDLQARSPAATVVLVTADLNLQNKAAAVGMPFADTDS